MSNKRQSIAPVALGFLIVVAIIAFYLLISQYNPKYPIRVWKDDWNVTCAGETYTDVSLKSLHSLLPPHLMRTDSIVLERKLDADAQLLPSPTLTLNVNLFAVDVFVDGVKIDDCAMDAYSAGDYVGGNHYFISLPADYAGKDLRLVYYAGEDRLPPIIHPVRFGSFHDLVWSFLADNTLVLLSGIFLCFFGGFFLVFSLFFSVLLPDVPGQKTSSILSIVLGVWLLTHYRALVLFSSNRFSSTIEYLAFYASLLLLYYLVDQICRPGRIYRTIFYANIELFAVAVLLHFMHIAPLYRFRNVFYLLSTFFLAILYTLVIKDVREKNTGALHALQLAGPLLFCSMTFIAMFFYMATRGDYTDEHPLAAALCCIGALLFAMTRFMIYVWNLIEIAPQRQEFSSLNRMAYTDSLTGLLNRMHLDEYFLRLNRSLGDYGLISMDLNDLKTINDTLGHSAGDRWLKAFATLLRTAFPEEATIMRIGGDEFAVVWEGVGESELRERMRTLDRQFDALKEPVARDSHRVAYGIAFRHEVSSVDHAGTSARKLSSIFHPAENSTQAQEVLKLADRRMYEHKHSIKKSDARSRYTER